MWNTESWIIVAFWESLVYLHTDECRKIGYVRIFSFHPASEKIPIGVHASGPKSSSRLDKVCKECCKTAQFFMAWGELRLKPHEIVFMAYGGESKILRKKRKFSKKTLIRTVWLTASVQKPFRNTDLSQVFPEPGNEWIGVIGNLVPNSVVGHGGIVCKGGVFYR